MEFVELFQTLKDDAVKAARNMPANLENSAVATGLEKVGFHSNPKERGSGQQQDSVWEPGDPVIPLETPLLASLILCGF